jgi:hypothetical protein
MNQRLTVELEYIKENSKNENRAWRALIPADAQWDEVPVALHEMAAEVEQLIKNAADAAAAQAAEQAAPIDVPVESAPLEPEVVS